jgi:hypothetical protein
MGTIRKQVELNATPESVWDAVRDFGALHTRLVPGFVTDTRLDGADRIVTFANGAAQRELLVALDNNARRLVYSAIDSPSGATHYNAAVQVLGDDDGPSTLVWTVDFLPDDIAAGLEAAMERGTQAMRQAFAPALR